MHLRDNINAPHRLENDDTYEESPRQSLRRSRAQPPRRYVDYNPNLPPASFPTLDEPRVPEKADTEVLEEKGQTIQSQPTPSNEDSGNHSDPDKQDTEARVDLKDVPNYSLEGWVLVEEDRHPIYVSWVASNGDYNPVYTRNMDIMAHAGNDTSLVYSDMEDSDSEVVNFPDEGAMKESIPAPSPDWSDLTPRLQVEITNNLLRHHSWSTIVHMLGLTAKQCEKVQEYMAQRARQMDLEDSQLRRMREKQLKGLLKMDNSALKNNRSPYKFVFRRTSRQYGRRLSDAIKIDFFSCYPGELVNARRFLNKRGIDQSYAGEWSNGIAVWRATEDEKKYTDFETGSPLVSTFASMDGCADGETSDFDLPASKGSQLNIAKYPGWPKDLFERQGDPTLLSSVSCHELGDGFRIARGSHSLRSNDGIKPLRVIMSLPPIICQHVEPMPPQPSTTELTNMVARRHLVHSIPASGWLKEKLEKITLEVEQGVSRRLEDKMTRDDSDHDWLSAFPLLGSELTSSESHSQLTSPGRIMLERNPDDIQADEPFADFDDILVDIEDVVTDDEVMITPDSNTEESRPASPTPSSLGFSDHVQSITSYVETTPEIEISDCNGDSDEEDEMVLVPTPSPSSANGSDCFAKDSCNRSH